MSTVKEINWSDSRPSKILERSSSSTPFTSKTKNSRPSMTQSSASKKELLQTLT